MHLDDLCFFFFLFRTILVWCWLLSVLYFLKSSHLKFLIFQEQKIREGLYMMGLKDGIFHLSWFITYALQVNFVLFPWQNHHNCPFFIEHSKNSGNSFTCYFANILVMWQKKKQIIVMWPYLEPRDRSSIHWKLKRKYNLRFFSKRLEFQMKSCN